MLHRHRSDIQQAMEFILKLSLQQFTSVCAMLLFSQLITSYSFAKTSDVFVVEKSKAEKILTQYANSKAVKFEIEKTDEKKVLGTKKTTKGQLTIAGSKFNLLTTGERKTEIISTGKKMWLIEYADSDFEPSGKRKVTELSKKQPLLARQIVQIFSNPKKFMNTAQVDSAQIVNDEISLNIKPASKDLRSFQLMLNQKIFHLTSISFTDDVDTLTTIKFTNVQKLTKVPTKMFEFKKQKTDEVF